MTIAPLPSRSVLLINPNTSRWVTDKLVAHLRPLLDPAVELRGETGAFGAAYIDSQASFDTGAEAVLDAWARHDARHAPEDPGSPPDAVLIGCFGDPGLEALRRAASPVPVLGLAQAALGEAYGAGRFAIVTGGRAWKPMLERTVASFGWDDRLDNITVIEQSGADLAADPRGALRLLAAACREAAGPGVTRVVLGGAGFAGYGDAIREEVPVPVIDSVSAAARALLALFPLEPRREAGAGLTPLGRLQAISSASWRSPREQPPDRLGRRQPPGLRPPCSPPQAAVPTDKERKR